MHEGSNGYSFRDDLFPDSNANALIFLARVWKVYLYLTCSIVPGATVSGSLVYHLLLKANRTDHLYLLMLLLLRQPLPYM